MMTERSVPDAIRAFLQETFPALRGVPLGDDDSLLESGAIDSLGLLEIVTFLETRLGARLSDDDVVIENFESVAAIARLAEQRGAESSVVAPRG